MSKKILICLLALICFFTINVKADDTDTDLELVEVVEEIIEDEVDDDEDEALSNDLEQENEEESVILDDSINDDGDSSALDAGESEEEPVTDDIDSENITPIDNQDENEEESEVVENENYEVTFSHNEYRLSIQGGSSILLSNLSKKLGINISMSDIDEITISNEEVLALINVQDSNDYVIKSLKSFNTEEKLIIKLKDGNEIIIKVVDPVGQTPAHDKGLVDNGDGTYTISLTVTGDAEKQITKVNVIVVLDTSNSMNTNTGNQVETYTPVNGSEANGNNLYGLVDGEYVALTREGGGPNGGGPNARYYYNTDSGRVQYPNNLQRYTQQRANQTRMDAAKEAVNSIANALLSNNGANGNPNDTVEMALINFNANANTNITSTTSYQTFSAAVNNLNVAQGTNWEAALAHVNDIDFGDNDQIYVIFVSDGNPSIRDSANGYDGDFGRSVAGKYGQFNAAGNDDRAYEASIDEAQAIVESGMEFYTIGAYGDVDRMQDLTTDAGALIGNYYEANNTAALQAALNAILSKIEMAGIGAVSINDGTTNSVTTSSGVSSLLDVDTTSFKYYKGNEEWTNAPAATLNSNGEVVWDLSSENVLENGVTYKVTFVVWPSQTTLDLIADLKNHPDKYTTLDANIKKYLVKDGDSYTLLTNTVASLSFKDTREENPQTHTSTYTNPSPVSTMATQLLTIVKEWRNTIDEREKREVEIAVLKDGSSWDTVVLNSSNNWEDGLNIAVGIITVGDDGKYVVRALGHDFSFGELGDEAYNWELKSDIVRPMYIDGELKLLKKYGTDEPENGSYYKIDGYYYIESELAEAKLIATNERRSLIDISKTVKYDEGFAHFDDQLFYFEITVETPNKENVWFSVMDKLTEELVKIADGLEVDGAEAEEGDTGYFFVASGETFTVGIKTGWNLRIINLLTGTTYTITETDIDSKFKFEDIDYIDTTYLDEDGEEVDYVPKITDTKVEGVVMATNTSYGYEFINKNVSTEITVTKIWDDQDNKYNLRPEDLVLKLSDGTTVVAQPEKVVNEDGTWTYVYKNLEIYDEEGNKLTYTIEEEIPDQYVAIIEGNQEEGFTITNILASGDGEPPENPQTADNILLSVITLIISVIGIVFGKKYIKES